MTHVLGQRWLRDSDPAGGGGERSFERDGALCRCERRGCIEAYAADYGIESFPLLWDGSFATWQELEVFGQPAGMLFSPGGELLAGWQGPIPQDEVLEAIDAIS